MSEIVFFGSLQNPSGRSQTSFTGQHGRQIGQKVEERKDTDIGDIRGLTWTKTLKILTCSAHILDLSHVHRLPAIAQTLGQRHHLKQIRFRPTQRWNEKHFRHGNSCEVQVAATGNRCPSQLANLRSEGCILFRILRRPIMSLQ